MRGIIGTQDEVCALANKDQPKETSATSPKEKSSVSIPRTYFNRIPSEQAVDWCIGKRSILQGREDRHRAIQKVAADLRAATERCNRSGIVLDLSVASYTKRTNSLPIGANE